MNKNVFVCLSLLLTSAYQHTYSAKDETLKVSFECKITPLGKTQNPDFEYCANILKQCSDLQKKRKLTFEEMLAVIHIVIFMLNDDEQSRNIEILLDNKYKIVIPFSRRLLDTLMENNNDQSSNDNAK